MKQNVLCQLQQVLVILNDGTDFRKAPFYAPFKLAFFEKDMTNAIPQTHRVIVRQGRVMKRKMEKSWCAFVDEMTSRESWSNLDTFHDFCAEVNVAR